MTGARARVRLDASTPRVQIPAASGILSLAVAPLSILGRLPVEQTLGIVALLAAGAAAGWFVQSRLARRHARRADTALRSLQREVQERSLAERELRDSRQRIQAILDTTVDAIITIDEQGIIQSCNRAVEAVFGYTPGELLRQSVGVLMPSPHREEHDAYIARYLHTGQSRIIGTGREVMALRKDGTRIPIDLAVSHVRLDEAHFFTAVIRDARERKRLEAGLVAAGEKVRHEIGRELHDALGQQLTGISLLAKTLDRQLASRRDPLQAEAEAVVELTRKAMEQIRTLSQGLYPVDLRRLGLHGALQELAETANRLFHVEYPLQIESSGVELPEEAALHVYRIAQEATNNAVRHGKATCIRLVLRRQADQLELRIEDDGSGIPDTPPAGNGLGLSIMAYRASLLGGTLDIQPSPEGGVTVLCRMPLQAGSLEAVAL